FGRSIGTSAATAEWAGIVALADQAGHHRLGSLNPRLYSIAQGEAYSTVLHDITSGTSTFHTFTGFSARPSWDAVTGLGTPDVAELVSLLRASEAGNEESDQTSESGARQWTAGPLQPAALSDPLPVPGLRLHPQAD